MTPLVALYGRLEPRDAPVRVGYCEWPVKAGRGVRQCSRKVRERIQGHGFCHPHGKLVAPSGGSGDTS
jgi:hypothetical protein